MLGRKEEEVASWILWEQQSIIGRPDTVKAMRDNVILQLMINKFFDGKAGSLLHLSFNGNLGLYGEGKLSRAAVLCPSDSLSM